MNSFNNLKKWVQLQHPEQFWVGFLYPLSAISVLAIRIIPLRYLVVVLGDRSLDQPEQVSTVTGDQINKASRLGLTMLRVAHHTPWETKCLAQAICTILLLRFYRIPYMVHIGLKHSSAEVAREERRLYGHAWVVVGNRVICGEQEHSSYAVLNTFISPSRSKSKHHIGKPGIATDPYQK